MGYVPSELEEMAEANGLDAAGTAWLGEMSDKELRGRETKRRQGDYPNMTRYNLRWIRRANLCMRCEPDRCWTLAMVFRKARSARSRRQISLAIA